MFSQTYMKICLDAKLFLTADPNCNLNLGDVPQGKVYAHLGMCTTGDIFCKTQITPFQSDIWEHVVGNWGPLPADDGVGLMVNEFTPIWEIEYLKAHERGHLMTHLDEVLTLLKRG